MQDSEMKTNKNANQQEQIDSPSTQLQSPAGTIPLDDLPLARLDDLPEKLREGATRAGWSELMPVQARALPYIFSQRDMMIQSRTGSGKTGAYLLPILEMVNTYQPTTQALVLVPTRELALQVATDAELLGRTTGVRSIAVYGGVGYGEQLEAFKEGAHLVIGTPGRILDHLMRRSLVLDHLSMLVFDEADRMLSMGFYPDMRRVQYYMPKKRVSSYMFSATFPVQVLNLANQFLHEPGFLNLSSDHIHVTETEHVYYTVPGMDKDRGLIRIIEVENPVSALIFCNTKARVNYVTTVLQRFGYDADDLTSDLAQASREKVLGRVRKGTLRFLVATDVAARGIDLPELSHVIQYEVPEDSEAYIHRAGRTGRAGGSGTAITLVSVLELPGLMRIAKQFNINFQEQPLPTNEDVETIVAERITTLLEGKFRNRDKLQNERMQRFLPLVNSLSENEDGSQLLGMLLDDFYQETFHAPVVPPDESSSQLKSARVSSRPSSGGRSRRPRDRRKRR